MSEISYKQWQKAEELLQGRDVSAAAAAYESLLGDNEFATPASLRLSLIASRTGRYRDAVRHVLQGFAARTQDADALDLLCKRLLMLGEVKEAVACAEELLALELESPQAPAEIGKLMIDAMMPELSLKLLQRARALGLDTPGVSYLVGIAHMYIGEMEKAEFEFERALRDEPLLAHAHWALSKLKRYSAGDNHVERLRAAVGRVDRNGQNASLLNYALFKELDDLGQVDEAWSALDRGMRARRQNIRFDPRDERALFDQLLVKDAGGNVGGGADIVHDGAIPIFIVGLPRSGTTLLEAMLGNHPDVAACGELNDATLQLRWMCDSEGAPHLDVELARRIKGINHAEYGRRYLEHTQWRARGRGFYTDKMPENFLNIGMLARAIPAAKILHVARGPMDACFSNLKELFAAAYPYSYDQEEMALHYQQYRDLMQHWHLAFPGRIFDVSYEVLVAEPQATLQAICEFCGLQWDPGVVNTGKQKGAIATASTAQVREPVHQRFVAQWRRYESHLEPLRQRLGPYGG